MASCQTCGDTIFKCTNCGKVGSAIVTQSPIAGAVIATTIAG